LYFRGKRGAVVMTYGALAFKTLERLTSTSWFIMRRVGSFSFDREKTELVDVGRHEYAYRCLMQLQ